MGNRRFPVCKNLKKHYFTEHPHATASGSTTVIRGLKKFLKTKKGGKFSGYQKTEKASLIIMLKEKQIGTVPQNINVIKLSSK